MVDASEVEAAIPRHVAEQGSCASEELFRSRSLSHFTLNQVFFATDRLSGTGESAIAIRPGMTISSQQQVLALTMRSAPWLIG
jgi:hypothetical protein